MGLATSHTLEPPPLYQTRNPRATALYQLLEAYYEDVKSLWEERFETKYGFWRGFVDQVVARYLDCGVEEAGFARLQCQACGAETLLTLSCKQRGICPSCDLSRRSLGEGGRQTCGRLRRLSQRRGRGKRRPLSMDFYSSQNATTLLHAKPRAFSRPGETRL